METFIMTEKKRGPGRPRKYETDAERKKAYRERQKAKKRELEIRVKELEEKLGIKSTNDQLLALTYDEVTQLDNESLNQLRIKIGGKLGGSTSLFSIFDYFVNSMHDFRGRLEEKSKQKISVDVTNKLTTNTDNLKYLIIQYIINLEIAKRKGSSFIESELDLLDRKIAELEERALKKKEKLLQK